MSQIVRKARINDVPQIYEFLKGLSQKGLLLPRSLSNLYEMIQTFWVAEDVAEPGRILGTGALQVSWEDLAEVRSLGVLEECRRLGLGARITQAIEDEARTLGVARMFVLTYVPDFFKHLDYTVIKLEDLPQKIWAVCFQCVHYPNCKEIAMIKDL